MLAKHGIVAEGMEADIDEKAVTAGFADRSTADPEALTLAIARAKSAVLRERVGQDDAILITCGKIVALLC